MRNNKNISREELKVGMKIKAALPTWCISKRKDRLKRLSWFKGKITCVNDNGSFSIYLGSFVGRMFIGSNQPFRIVKCL